MLKIKNNILYSCLCSNPSRDRRLHMSENSRSGRKPPKQTKTKPLTSIVSGHDLESAYIVHS